MYERQPGTFSDMLLIGMHASCPGDSCFRGKVVYINGEPNVAPHVTHSYYLCRERYENHAILFCNACCPADSQGIRELHRATSKLSRGETSANIRRFLQVRAHSPNEDG